MANEYDIIILRKGLRSELTAQTLQTGEPGFTTDTNQVFIGTDNAVNEIVFDPFANAHAIVQSWLDSPSNPEPGLVIDEDLVIRNVTNVDTVLAAMQATGAWASGLYARPRNNVEVITENSFIQLFADQHLSSLSGATGLRSSLFNKTLSAQSGNFLSYNKEICTSFFIDYSLKQTDGNITYIRVGTIKVINGYPQFQEDITKLTDENTEIWKDHNNDNLADINEFSNICFHAEIPSPGSELQINYTQDAGFSTEIYYTIKRWSM